MRNANPILDFQLCNNHMRVYAGTYQGHLLILQGSPFSLTPIATRPISQNSIRTLRHAGDELLIGGYDQELRSVSSVSGVERKESKESLGVINCIANVNEKISAIGLENGTIRFWDRVNWNSRKDLREHKKPVRDIKLDAKGLLMVSIAGKEMIFWNISNFTSLYHYEFDFQLEHVLLVDSFEYLFLLGDHKIRQLSTEDNSEISKVDIYEKIQCGLIFTSYLLVATQKGEIKIWTHGTFEHCIHFKAHSTRIKAMKAVSIDEVDYLVTADSNGDISTWDILQFLKGVDSISQDYHLEGLQPIFTIATKTRIICLDVVAVQERPVEEEEAVEEVVVEKVKDKKKKIHKQAPAQKEVAKVEKPQKWQQKTQFKGKPSSKKQRSQ